MLNKSHIVVAFIALLVGISGTVFYLMPEQPILVDSRQTTSPDDSLTVAVNKIKILEKELAEARARLYTATTASAEKNILLREDTDNSILANKAQHEYESRIAELESNRLMQWIADKTNNDPQFALDVEMQSRFDAETINIKWASAQEASISTLFAEHEDLSGFAFKHAQCRSTQCQISIGIADMEQANLVATKMASVVAKRDFLSAIAIPDLGSGVTTIYISNNANGFELN